MAEYARGDIAHHTMLPVLTLAAITFAGTMLLTRSSMLETLREDYILTARAKGLSEKAIRTGMPPGTPCSLSPRHWCSPWLSSLMGIVTEYIFSWPSVACCSRHRPRGHTAGDRCAEHLPDICPGRHRRRRDVYMLLDPRIRAA